MRPKGAALKGSKKGEAMGLQGGFKEVLKGIFGELSGAKGWPGPERPADFQKILTIGQSPIKIIRLCLIWRIILWPLKTLKSLNFDKFIYNFFKPAGASEPGVRSARWPDQEASRREVVRRPE
jgi:hypothetical protein